MSDDDETKKKKKRRVAIIASNDIYLLTKNSKVRNFLIKSENYHHIIVLVDTLKRKTQTKHARYKIGGI